MEDSRLTTIDNPFDPFEQFTLWYMFDMSKGYNTCGRLARITHYTEDMTDKEYDAEHERGIDRMIELDFMNIYKKVQRGNKKPLDIGAAPL